MPEPRGRFYLPGIGLVMQGLGIEAIPEEGPVTVNAAFLRFMLGEMARAAAFDPGYYASNNPDVAAAVAAGGSVALHDHFCTHGFFEGRAGKAPSFDPVWYAQRYPDLRGLDAEELRTHFEEVGRLEGRAGARIDIEAEAWGEASGLSAPPAEPDTLAHATLEEARVEAFSELFAGGPVLDDDVLGDDELNRLNQRLRHTRYRTPVDRFAPVAEFHHRLPGTWIYGGPAHDHFGHVMSEMVHRLVPAMRLFGPAGFLFVGAAEGPPVTGADSLPDFFQDILRFLGIPGQSVRVLHRNHIIERLHIVEQGSDFGGRPKPGYLAELRDFSQARLRAHATQTAIAPAELVYVSRSALVPLGGFLGERCVEAALAAAGFLIFHPEAYRLADQMAVYHRARVLLFAEGSACHGTELLGEGMLQTCLLLARRRNHLDIFDAILAPRALTYEHMLAGAEIGTLAADPVTGAPLDHLGIALIDTAKLRRWLRRHGVETPAIDTVAYADAAKRDFTATVDWHRAHSNLLNPAAIAAAETRLDAALKHLATG